MSVPREARLGIFVGLMQAIGRADPVTLAQVDAAQENYSAGYISPATFQQRIDDLLGLTIPIPA